jgi:hypothetical protein
VWGELPSLLLLLPGPGLPDFSGYNIPKREIFTKRPTNIQNGHEIYLIAKKSTKWPKNLPNGQKIYQMAKKSTKWP